MLASRVAKPKLSLSISTNGASNASTRPSLSLRSPLTLTPLRSPASPLPPASPTPTSPTARNTRLNQRGSYYQYSTMTSSASQQQPTYTYKNSSSARSILKKPSTGGTSSSTSTSGSRSVSSAASSRRQCSFTESPIVYSVTPIEEPDYYGSHVKMSRDERRWGSRR